MRRFYLYKRGKNYYCQLKNPQTGNLLPAKSTGTSDREKAEFIAQKWLYEGFPSSGGESVPASHVFTVDQVLSSLKDIPSLTPADVSRFLTFFENQGLLPTQKDDDSPQLIPFLLDFWEWSGPYVKEKKAYQQSIGQNHVQDMQRRIRRYWKPYFNQIDPSLKLSGVTRDQLREFSIWLSKQHKKTRDKERRELPEVISPRTCNIILKAGTVAINWAHNNGLIVNNPAKGLKKFGLKVKRRGILSDDEMQKLITAGDWKKNEGARLASLLASQTGLRIGEVIALQVGDIGADRLFIRHSYSKVDGLKSTKTGETRQVPILPETRKAILEWAKKNPFDFGLNSFVFFQADNGEAPMRAETISARFRGAVESIIGEEERKARNIVFHGLRHYYIKKMSLALDKRAMMLSGHKSAAVFENYADHASAEDFKKAAAATAEVFGRILPFTKTG